MLYAVISGFVAAAVLPLLHRFMGERSTLVAALVPLALTTWFALLALLAVLLLVAPLRRVLGGALGRDLIPVIQATGFAEIGVGLGLLAGVWL